MLNLKFALRTLFASPENVRRAFLATGGVPFDGRMRDLERHNPRFYWQNH